MELLNLNFTRRASCLKALLVLILTGILACFSFVNAQEAELTTFDSEAEGLYFDQALIYSYSDHTGRSEDVWIFYSSCSGRFLFEQSSWGMEDEMIHYIIAQPDGSYLTFGTEAEGSGTGKVVQVDSVYLEDRNQLAPIPAANEYIEFVAIPKENKTVAGLESKAFEVRKLKEARGFEKILLAETDFDTRMIYSFNQLGYDLRLPEGLGQSYGLGANQLITQLESSYTDSSGKTYWSKLELLTIDPTTYWAPYADFTFWFRDNGGALVELPMNELVKLCRE